jgi:hypothetical protein
MKTASKKTTEYTEGTENKNLENSMPVVINLFLCLSVLICGYFTITNFSIILFDSVCKERK